MLLQALESEIEDYFVAQIKKIGGLTYKFTSPGTDSVPDRLVLFKDLIELVELKRPGKTLRKNQISFHKKIKRKTEHNIYLIDTKEKVDLYIRHLLFCIVIKFELKEVEQLYSI